MFYVVGKLQFIFIYTQRVGMEKNYQSGDLLLEIKLGLQVVA
jgi:hypothetical protein